MSGAWLTQSVNNPNSFKKAIEIRLKDQWITTWNTNLIMKNICNSYRMYKVVYVMEEYLVKSSKKNRIMLSKLRACNNNLPIIEGRYRNISKEERICNMCENNFVGDEFHMLFVCQNENIVRLRNMYIPEYYKNRPSLYKYGLLIQTTSCKTLNNLALFLQAVFKMMR